MVVISYQSCSMISGRYFAEKRKEIMFSKLLLKLIDQAIVPAVLLVSARIISIVLISQKNGLPFDLSSNGFSFYSMSDYVAVNTLSTFFMAVALSLGLGYIILKSLVFHDSHIKPHTSAKLFTLKLSHLIQTSYNIYTQGAVWISYLYLLTLSAGVMTISGMINSWVFYVCLILSFLYTLLFVLDIEAEIDLNKKQIKDTNFLEI